jgi:hypothetical protein
MITANLAGAFERLAARLTARAEALAEAAAVEKARPGDPLRWRDARLLWPLFTKD